MKFHFLAAVASAAIAVPAAAQTGPYVGADLGALMIQRDHAEYQGLTGAEDGPLTIHHNLGIDADVNAGYDFGMFRLEGELGYKSAGIDHVDYTNPAFGPLYGDGGHARTLSAMVNGLVDIPLGDTFKASLGGGVGYAKTQYKVDALHFQGTDGNFAWQLLAGISAAVSPNMDVGLKYRYFNTKYDVGEGPTEEILGNWKSHSLLASLTYHFGGAVLPPPPPPPPAPPPPPPPATQTCPDGTVILATATCPTPPPPPPPPPPPAGERG